MNLINKRGITFFLIASSRFIEGAGTGGSVGDLLFPATNFFILGAFFIFVLRKKVSLFFQNNAKEVEGSYKFSQEKDRDAQEKLEIFEKKVSFWEQEKEKLLKDLRKEQESLSSKLDKETEEVLKVMKKNLDKDMEREKKTMRTLFNKEVLEEVIKKAKEKIKGDTSLKEKIVTNLVSKADRN